MTSESKVNVEMAGSMNEPDANEREIATLKVDEAPGVRKSILVLSRELSGNVGGVVSYVRAEEHAFAADFEFVQMNTGSRAGENSIQKLRRLVEDPYSLIKLIRKKTFDVVQLNPSMKVKPLIRDGLFSWLIQREGRGKLVIVFHGWTQGVADHIESRRVIRQLFLLCFGRANLYVVLSPRFASKLTALGISKSRIRVLPSMFDDRDLSSFEVRPKSKENIVLFMSRMDKKKGALELIEAFAQGATSLWKSWKLVVAGEGVEKRNAESLVKSLALGDRISVVGQLIGPAKIDMFARASVFALPTVDDEGLPISVLEAMAAGCALLTTSAGGLAEALSDKEHGVVMESVSIKSISDGLQKLSQDEEFRHQCQRNCHQAAWGQYASSIVVGRFQEMLYELD